MNKAPFIAYLAEPNSEKKSFFWAISKEVGNGVGVRLKTWPLSWKNYPETEVRALTCLARAKKQPKGALGRWVKLAFLKGRYNWSRSYFESQPEAIALCWQGLTGTRRAFMEGAKDAGAHRLFAELAPLPSRRTLDPEGINAEGSVPRNPNYYDDVDVDQKLLAEIRDSFQARVSRRTDVRQNTATFETDSQFLFVPLQVPDDSQMTLFAGWCGGLNGFLDALAKASTKLPEGWHLRLKEHPSSKTAVTPQINAHIKRGARFILDNETDSFELIKASRGVVTINSSMGLQAMFFEKPVVITGDALYDINGILDKAANQSALTKILKHADALEFDQDLRQRFLTWLACDYYVKFSREKPLQLTKLIKNLNKDN